MSRRTGGNFTQQDLAVARLFVRRLAEGVPTPSGPLAPLIWTRQLEAIQRIAARLNRLGSIDEVGATICRGTFEVIDHDEAHLLLADDKGYLRPTALATADGGTPPALPYDGPIAAHIDRALAGAKPVLVHALPETGAERVGPHSLLLVPLIHESPRHRGDLSRRAGGGALR